VRKQVLIRRYTHGLVNAIPSRDEFLAVQARLAQFQGLLAEKPQFLEVLSSPFFPHSKRAGIASEVLTELFGMQKTPQEPADKKRPVEDTSPEAKAKRFILLLIENDRLEILDDILENFPAAWDKEHGIVFFEVSSVTGLSPEQKERLEEKLRRLDKKPVSLKYVIDPSLIGGLSIRKGNILYDVSIRGSLERLKEKIGEK